MTQQLYVLSGDDALCKIGVSANVAARKQSIDRGLKLASELCACD